MNKLITTANGGFPFVSDDLRWLQDGLSDILAAHLSAFVAFTGNDNLKLLLSGCNITFVGDLVTMHEGYIFWQKEIFKVQEHSLLVINTDMEFVNMILDVQYDPAGDKITLSSTSIQSYQIRTLKMSLDVTPIEQNYNTIKQDVTYKKLLKNMITSQLDVWHSFSSYHNDHFYGTGNTPVTEYRKFYIDIDNFIHLKGAYFIEDAGAIEITICVLPTGYRPISDISYTYILTPTPLCQATITIKTTGEIKIQTNIDTYFLFWLHQITPFRTS